VLAAKATESSVIDMLAARRVLRPSQVEAALKFRLDYQRAALARPVTGSYSPSTALDNFHVTRERTDAEEAAYQKWRNAVGKLGIQLSGIAISTICFDLVPTPHDILLLQIRIGAAGGVVWIAEGKSGQIKTLSCLRRQASISGFLR
jgi:hypothetical protein